MINEDIKEYMRKIKIINKDISEYKDEEKGIKYVLNTPQLLTRVDLLELTKEELEIAKFKGQVDKKEYKMYDTTRPVPKYEITKVEADKYVITDKKIKATRIYNVTNQLGIKKSFEDKDEAFALSDKINKEVIIEL